MINVLNDGFYVDLSTVNEDHKVWIATEDGSGAEYYVKSKEDIIAAVSKYIDNYVVGSPYSEEEDVEENYKSVNPAELTDCPACGDISFDSKHGRCTKCGYRE